MSILFNQTVFGPVKSRRLGISLGMNLLPKNRKLCTFDCIYCECGWNANGQNIKPELPTPNDVRKELSSRLKQMAEEKQLPNVITFAGNGEPTIHPQFEEIIGITIELRNQYAPDAKIAVLSNATTLSKESVVSALKQADEAILKLDGGFEETIRTIDKPVGPFHLEQTIKQLTDFGEKAIIQTLFVEGIIDGKIINNATDEEVDAWISLIQTIKPHKVMVYTIDRDTPTTGLKKISKKKLDEIAQRLTSKVNTLVDVAG